MVKTIAKNIIQKRKGIEICSFCASVKKQDINQINISCFFILIALFDAYFLNEQKAKENNIDIEECYLKVDRFFKRRGVTKLDKGIYFGKKSDFDNEVR